MPSPPLIAAEIAGPTLQRRLSRRVLYAPNRMHPESVGAAAAGAWSSDIRRRAVEAVFLRRVSGAD